MSETTISKPIHKILTYLTGEERLDVSLPLATKDLVSLKLKASEEKIKQFEEHYSMQFKDFKIAWENGKVKDKYSYEVEKDYWEWETAITDQQRLMTMLEELL